MPSMAPAVGPVLLGYALMPSMTSAVGPVLLRYALFLVWHQQ